MPKLIHLYGLWQRQGTATPEPIFLIMTQLYPGHCGFSLSQRTTFLMAVLRQDRGPTTPPLKGLLSIIYHPIWVPVDLPDNSIGGEDQR